MSRSDATARPAAAEDTGAPDRARRPLAPALPALELLGVGRIFGTEPQVVALRDVDLTLARGSSLAILGPSGAGKSTLMNILGCLDRPTSGSYRLNGIDAGALSDDERAAVRAEEIGFIFQTFNLLAHRSVLDNVMLAEVYRGGNRDGRAERALAALAQVGMTKRADFLPTRLSGGEQQRVAVARALLGEPTILLCDEPTGNLDSANTQAILAIFDELREAGMTLVTVTHEEQVARHARRRVHIIDGRLTEEVRQP